MLHIVFNPSAAVSLRDALREEGQDDRVIAFFDCLSFGPIDSSDPATRAKWVEDELGYDNWDEIAGQSESFWQEAVSSSDRKIAWTSRRSTQEYTGFLEWVWRLGDAPAEFIDLTDVIVTGPMGSGPAHLPLLLPCQIRESGLLDRAEELTPTLRKKYRELWGRLRAENAPFRILDEQGLSSAPLSHFDAQLMSLITAEWQKAALVVGYALGDFWDTSLMQTGDLVYAARLCALAEAGLIEARGDLPHLQRYEVRRL